jgi:hypothetical protein
MNCKACNGEMTRVIDTNEIERKGRTIVKTAKDNPNHVEIIVGCEYCIASDLWEQGHISYTNAKKFCKCFNSGHDKNNLK